MQIVIKRVKFCLRQARLVQTKEWNFRRHDFLDVVPYLKQNKTSLSVLPFHHSTEVNTHIYTRMADGKLIVICDSIKNFWRFLKKFHPDETIVVPMIANAIYKNIYTNNKNPKSFKRRLRLHKFLSFFGINTSRKIFKKEFEFFTVNQFLPFGVHIL